MNPLKIIHAGREMDQAVAELMGHTVTHRPCECCDVWTYFESGVEVHGGQMRKYSTDMADADVVVLWLTQRGFRIEIDLYPRGDGVVTAYRRDGFVWQHLEMIVFDTPADRPFAICRMALIVASRPLVRLSA